MTVADTCPRDGQNHPHEWSRQTRDRVSECRHCGAMRCQNYPAGGIKATRCDQKGRLSDFDGLVLCLDCGRNPTIDKDVYGAVNIRAGLITA